MGNTTRGDLLTSPQKRDPATPADAGATLPPVSIRAGALRTGPSVSHMRGRMSQGDRAASKGLPTTGALDASTTDVGPAPMHVGAVLILGTGPGFSVQEAQRLLGERVQTVPRLRHRLYRAPPGCGRPFWADDPAFDLRHHVRQLPCPPPGDERALLEVAAAVTRQPLPRSRPLWSATFVTGLAGGSTGLVIVMNHVLADGIGGLAVLAQLVDEIPGLPPGTPQAAGFPGPRSPRPHARRRRLGGPGAPPHPPGTQPAHDPAGPGRTGRRPPALHAPADIPEPPHRPAAAPRCCRRRSRRDPRPGSRPRRHRQRRDPRRHRRGAAGVAGQPGRRTRPGDSIGTGVGAAGSHRRPARQPGRGDAGGPARQRRPGRPRHPDRSDHRERKTAARGTSAALLGPFRLLSLTGLLRWFVDRQRRIHIFVTNLRGPAEPLTFAGAPVRAVIPIPNTTGNVTVAFGVLSYAGTLQITVLSDPSRVPDVAVLTAALRRELGSAAR
jgi:diacylglycerol O-acyltransferase / wax synthase